MAATNNIAFVILHYQNIDVTIESVDTLGRIHHIDNHHIVVVDNASPNNSGETLEEMYAERPNIHILRTERNGGFAYGNNIGYQYARNVLHAQIIVAMNSDVDIVDREFADRLLSYAEQHTDVSIVAPDIIIRNGFHQNPYMYRPIESRRQRLIILRKQIGWLLYSLPILGRVLINRESIRRYQPNKRDKIDQTVVNCVPHGACVIYLPEWTRTEELAFVEGTFLFVEEELLYDYCMSKHHQINYEPMFEVHHMEDASQDAVNVDALQKKRLQIQNEIQSRKLLLQNRRNQIL